MHRKPRPLTEIPPKGANPVYSRLLDVRVALASQHGQRSALAVSGPAKEKQEQSAQIARDVDAFLAAGGTIQTFAPGESAQSIRDAEAARIQRIQQRMRLPKAT